MIVATEQPTEPNGLFRLLPKAVRSRIGSKHVKFVIIGIYNTLFGYSVFAGLHIELPHVNYMFVLIVSREISVISAFVVYRLLVFKVKGRIITDFARFWLVYSGALVLNLIALPFFVEIVGLHVLVAQAVTLILTVISTWIGHNHFSFKRDHVDPDPSELLETV